MGTLQGKWAITTESGRNVLGKRTFKTKKAAKAAAIKTARRYLSSLKKAQQSGNTAAAQKAIVKLKPFTLRSTQARRR